MGPDGKGCKDHPTPSMSPGIRPHSCPRAPCTGHVPCPHTAQVWPCAPLGRGLQPATTTSASSSDKDSCHDVGRWCPAFLPALTPGELLCLWQNHTSAGACCQSGAMSQERHSCSLFRELQARSVLESPTCTQGSFQGRCLPWTGHGAEGKVLEPSWGWQELCQ